MQQGMHVCHSYFKLARPSIMHAFGSPCTRSQEEGWELSFPIEDDQGYLKRRQAAHHKDAASAQAAAVGATTGGAGGAGTSRRLGGGASAAVDEEEDSF